MDLAALSGALGFGGMDLAALSGMGFGGMSMGAGMPSMMAAVAPGMSGMPGMSGGVPMGTELPANQSLSGTVKAWMDDKGFGFVTPTGGGPDVFVHRNQLTDGERLVQGSLVTFECRFNPSRVKYEATSCSGAAAAGAVPPVQQVPPPASTGSGGDAPFTALGGGCGKGGKHDPFGGFGGKGGSQDNLFVAGLPMEYTEDMVRQLFMQYGTVTQCKVLPDQPGRNDKAALVRFSDEGQAKWMVQNMHGNIPVGMSSPLIVRYAGERGGKGGFGKAVPPPMTDNRFSPYGAIGAQVAMPQLALGGGVDANLAAALMQLMPGLQAGGSIPASTMHAGVQQFDANAFQMLGGLQGMAPTAVPAFDMSAYSAAVAVSTTPALMDGGAAAAAAAAATGVAAVSQPAIAGYGALAGGWQEAADPNTGKPYYYHTITRETRWDKPAEMG